MTRSTVWDIAAIGRIVCWEDHWLVASVELLPTDIPLLKDVVWRRNVDWPLTGQVGVSWWISNVALDRSYPLVTSNNDPIKLYTTLLTTTYNVRSCTYTVQDYLTKFALMFFKTLIYDWLGFSHFNYKYLCQESRTSFESLHNTNNFKFRFKNI